MNNQEKKNLLESLDSDQTYSISLSLVKDENERRKIKAYTQEIYLTLFQTLSEALQVEQTIQRTAEEKVEPK